MYRVNEDGLLEKVYAVEDLCEHCKKACSPQGMKEYVRIKSMNPRENYDYIVDCLGFESCDGIYRVSVEVEENPSLMDRMGLQMVADELSSRKG